MDDEFDETGSLSEIHRFEDSLSSYVRMQGLQDATTIAQVTACWRETVGENLANHAKPISMRDGELVVVVDHSAWATEVNFMAKTIRDALSNRLGNGVISAIKVHVRA